MYRYKFKKGFSIIEVLITLLVLSLILVLLAPVMTRKFDKTDTDGIVYTYVNSGSSTTDKNTNQDTDKCFITTTNSGTSYEYKSSQNCSSYEFVVPKGVTSVDLTLVAGGGGGGGASGAIYYDTYTLDNGKNGNISLRYGYDHLDTEASAATAEVKKSFNNGSGININDIKNVMIKYFMAAGQPSKLAGCEYQTCYNSGTSALDCARCAVSGTQTWKDFIEHSKSSDGKYLTGTGGISSRAVVDYEIPIENYQTRLSLDNIKPNGGKNLLINLIHEYNSRKQASEEFSKITMNLSLNDNSYSNLYSLYRTANETKDGGFGEYKDYVDIPKQVGSKGEVIKYDSSTKQLTLNGSNAVLGGKGGIVAGGKFGSCGSGAQGYSFVQKNGSKDVEYAPSLYPGPACAGISVVYLRENAAKTNGFVSPSGGGGAGGNAVKINGFEVSPNEKYIIRVGRGGRGGLGGSDVISDKTITSVSSTTAPTDKLKGEDGESGASTSIWKVNNDGSETLVFLVTGGLGGFGSRGYMQSGTDYKTSETTGGGASGRHPAMLFSGIESKDLPAEIKKLDNKVAVGTIANNDFQLGTSNKITVSGIKLEYPYLRQGDTISPFWYLNAYNTSQACRNNSSDICLGAFDRFDTKNNLVTVSQPVVDGQKSVDTNVYNGFYYRTLLENNRAGYTGGLGGFSGLGTKAGCGGLFMGNSRGITVNGESVGKTNELYKNRFIMPSDSGTNEDKNAYRVFDYYDNCTLNSNDGQSAEFILPNIRSKTLGQAGSGGGGGGYTVSDGAGKGGDGQNGYVMINWRK